MNYFEDIYTNSTIKQCPTNEVEFYTHKQYPTRNVLVCKVLKPICPQSLRVRKPIELRSLRSAIVSAQRSKKIIDDIIECNDWLFFVTLTLGIKDRLDDTIVKKEWTNWRRQFRYKYPNAYYIAIPEYHKRGGLHVHMPIGGLTADELKLVDSGYVCCSWARNRYITKVLFDKDTTHTHTPIDGLPIYNVGAWTLGHSTATKILFKKGVHAYLTKYITKGGVDPRFCDAKRYWVSRNVKRPNIEKWATSCNNSDLLKIDTNIYKSQYADLDKGYYIFEETLDNE